MACSGRTVVVTRFARFANIVGVIFYGITRLDFAARRTEGAARASSTNGVFTADALCTFASGTLPADGAVAIDITWRVKVRNIRPERRAFSASASGSSIECGAGSVRSSRGGCQITVTNSGRTRCAGALGRIKDVSCRSGERSWAYGGSVASSAATARCG